MKGNSCPSPDDKPTDIKIAEQSNVSARTVKNAEKFAAAVDKVAENLGPSLFFPCPHSELISWLDFRRCGGMFVSPVLFEGL